MDKENQWSEINKDVADIAKKVKSNPKFLDTIGSIAVMKSIQKSNGEKPEGILSK